MDRDQNYNKYENRETLDLKKDGLCFRA